MESPEDIEKALAALVPSAISEKGQRSLEDLIDNLAAGNAPLVEMEMSASRRLPWGWIGGLGVGAAAVLAMAFQIPAGPRAGSESPGSGPGAGLSGPDFTADDGGGVVSLARTYVNQERVRDMKTGYEVVVTCRPEGHEAPEEEARPLTLPVVAASGPDTSGLGLAMGDLDEAIRAQVPDLPRGFGFLVTTVEASGPYGKAGVQPNDILGKFDNQWLFNKAQFLTLLQLHKEGEEVKLGIYRSGKLLDVPVVLGSFPDELRAYTLALGSARSKDGELDMPMKVARPNDGYIDTRDGSRATLWQVRGISEVRIVSNSGSVIYEGLVRNDEGVFLVPESWQAGVEALERGLSHVVRENSRPPRLRTVPVRQDLGDK